MPIFDNTMFILSYYTQLNYQNVLFESEGKKEKRIKKIRKILKRHLVFNVPCSFLIYILYVPFQLPLLPFFVRQLVVFFPFHDV